MAKKQPTRKQIEVYMLSEVRRMTHVEIGEMLGIERSSVTYRLNRLEKNHPVLFQKNARVGKRPRIRELDVKRDGDNVVRKF